MAALFARLRGPQVAPGATGAFLGALRLVSWDATMLDVPDSPANQAAFLASRTTRGRGAYPKVRLLQLIECGTHAVIDAAFGAVSDPDPQVRKQHRRGMTNGCLASRDD